MYRDFFQGDVLITIGTGHLASDEEDRLGLAGEHDYAILDMQESDNRRQLLVKNPWTQGTIWKSKAQQITSSLVTISEESGDEAVPGGSSDAGQLAPGTFWIDLESVVQDFDSIYLSWNPSRFQHRIDHHFSWDLSAVTPQACFRNNPQYGVISPAGGLVWLLLSRHIKSGEGREPAETSGRSRPKKGKSGYITLYVFDSGGRRVLLSDGALHRGPYVDSLNTLVRLDVKPKTSYTIVVAQQSLPSLSYSFSLSTYTINPATVGPARDEFSHSTTQHAAWTTSTAGGNAGSPSYPSNPQFILSLTSRSDVTLLLETLEPDLSVQVKLVWSSGQRVTTISARDVVGSSGDYRRGCAVAALCAVAPGQYTVVCSTFSPGQLGAFSLHTYTHTTCTVRLLPAEEAGRRRTLLPPAHLAPGVNRVLAPLSPLRLGAIRVVARYAATSGSAAASALRVALELGQGPNKRELATGGQKGAVGGASLDGDFADARFGLRTADIDLQPDMDRRGGVWVVVERLVGVAGATVDETVEVEVLSEMEVRVGAWGVGEG